MFPKEFGVVRATAFSNSCWVRKEGVAGMFISFPFPERKKMLIIAKLFGSFPTFRKRRGTQRYDPRSKDKSQSDTERGSAPGNIGECQKSKVIERVHFTILCFSGNDEKFIHF
jgi:hypothetical protein